MSRWRWILLVVVVSWFTAGMQSATASEGDGPFAPVSRHFEYENANDWDAIPALWTRDMEKTLREFVSDPENRKQGLGLMTIKKARLVDWKEFPKERAMGMSGFGRVEERYGEAKVYYVAVEYEVREESKFYLNGINYFFAIVVKQDRKWKIALMPTAPVNYIVDDQLGFGTQDEREMAELFRWRHKGKFLNRKGEVVDLF